MERELLESLELKKPILFNDSFFPRQLGLIYFDEGEYVKAKSYFEKSRNLDL
jgi:hypothetical protein